MEKFSEVKEIKKKPVQEGEVSIINIEGQRIFKSPDQIIVIPIFREDDSFFMTHDEYPEWGTTSATFMSEFFYQDCFSNEAINSVLSSHGISLTVDVKKRYSSILQRGRFDTGKICVIILDLGFLDVSKSVSVQNDHKLIRVLEKHIDAVRIDDAHTAWAIAFLKTVIKKPYIDPEELENF